MHESKRSYSGQSNHLLLYCFQRYIWICEFVSACMHIHVYIHTYFGDCLCNYYPSNYSQTISARSFARDTVYCPFERSTFSIMRRVSFSSSSINSSSCNNGWVHGFDARLVKQICMDRVILQHQKRAHITCQM